MSPTIYSSKSRTEKLRSSCDSCHLSKVKCSKTRPLCSRCLVCGTDCTYSPSARVGRKSKKGGHTSSNTIALAQKTLPDDHHQIQANFSASHLTPYHNKHMNSAPEFNPGLSYTTTPSTSGSITLGPSEETYPSLFMDTQRISASEDWIHSPGMFDYFPWGADAIYPSLSSSEVIISEPNISWGTWCNTDSAQTPLMAPGIFSYPSDSTMPNPQYSMNCHSAANM